MAYISGSFPTGEILPSGGEFNVIGKPPISGSEYLSRTSSVFRAAMSRDAKIYLPGRFEETHFGPYDVQIMGTPRPVAQAKTLQVIAKSGQNNNPGWNVSKRSGDIIVSEFEVASARLQYSRGRDNVRTFETFSRSWSSYASNLFPRRNPSLFETQFQGDWYRSAGVVGRYEYIGFDEGEDPYESGWSDEDYRANLAERLKLAGPIDGIIAKTFASANRGTIDALTAVAELPETVAELYRAVRVCLSMYKDARNKAFRIYNKAKGNSNSATIRKNMKEAADAVANVWMTYRYSIMPNVYLIEDIIKTLETNASDYIRYRETGTFKLPSVNLNGFTGESDINVVNRCFIKRLLDVSGSLPEITKLMTTNIVITGWELTPLSFVADWFVNIGDLLATYTINPRIAHEGSTISWRFEGSEKFTHENHSMVTSEVTGYIRRLTNRSDAFCISFNSDLSVKQKLDSLALGWGALKKTFR
ncbi:MAG: maturation protein [Sanya levivirus 4]|uniref:Maturation protein n=1 Tax=Sanya levivirus 4 TaxID=2905512 RepID=A0A8K1XY23_9VIRU|nr:MAG: maturation protein [Sanya levivirus 4]